MPSSSIPLIWSLLLLSLFISSTHFPNGCNAADDKGKEEPAVGSKRKFEEGPSEKIPIQIIEEIKHFTSLKLTNADVIAVDEVTNIFEWNPSNKHSILFYQAIIAKIIFNRFKAIYYKYTGLVNDILAIFIEVQNKEKLDDSVNGIIFIVDLVVQLYKNSEMKNNKMINEMKQMHKFYIWLEKVVLQKIVKPDILVKKTNYQMGEKILYSFGPAVGLLTVNQIVQADGSGTEKKQLQIGEGTNASPHHGKMQQKDKGPAE